MSKPVCAEINHVAVNVANFGREVNLALLKVSREIDADTPVTEVMSLELREVPDTEEITPTISLSSREAQRLFDALWEGGFRSGTMDAKLSRMQAKIDDLEKKLKNLKAIL